jgi:class 3 adenylate cyclase/pSer/pThr/pTyr-binding forkhead associated (FHA) protein
MSQPPTSVTRILDSGSAQDVIAAELAKFRRNVTVLFTDIKGSTAYFTRFGDDAGLVMVHETNELLGGIVAKHGGWVAKTIGDAVMAVFEESSKAVTAAITMQRALAEKNARLQEPERVLVRIGLNYGPGIVKSKDVFGDVVNVASRVESAAAPEQIVISDTLKDTLGEASPFRVRYLGQFILRGKSEDRALFEVFWKDVDPHTAPPHTMLVKARPASALPHMKLLHIGPDGVVKAEIPLQQSLVIGRSVGGLTFPHDAGLQPRHAALTVENGQVFIHAEGEAESYYSVVGTYTLLDGDLVKMGKHTFRYAAKTDALSRAAAIGTRIGDLASQLAAPVAELIGTDDAAQHYSLDREEITFGRSHATYAFPQDPLMSRAHARVYHRGEDFFIEDLESRNGTFLKVRGKVPLAFGTRLHMAGQVFQLERAFTPAEG